MNPTNGMNPRSGFFWGLQTFSRAMARVWLEPDLRRWFFRTLAFTVFLALIIIISLFALGSWGFASYFESTWSTAAVLVLWALALFYVSGHLAALLTSALVLLIGGESALTRYYFRERAMVVTQARKDQIRQQFKDRTGEFVALFVSIGVACFVWPLFLFPLTMPLGVLIFSWAMAGDALAVAKRICHEGGYPALQDSQKLTASTRMGLAILPSSLALFPVIGWVLLPILQVAGLEAQLSQSHTQSSDKTP